MRLKKNCRLEVMRAGAFMLLLYSAPAAGQPVGKKEFMKSAIADINAQIARREKGRWRIFMKIPKVTPFVDWDYYYIEDKLQWIPSLGQDVSPVEVPKGFVTDLASVPRAFWSALRPTGRYAYAAIVHDYLYWTQNVSREEADNVLKAAMEDARVDSGIARAVYETVRAFGANAWEQNRKARDAGEKRILVEFPGDPLISWSEWKGRAGVFGHQ